MVVIRPSKIEPNAQPWARDVTTIIKDNSVDITRNKQDTLNTTKAQAAQISLLQRRIANPNPTYNSVTVGVGGVVVNSGGTVTVGSTVVGTSSVVTNTFTGVTGSVTVGFTAGTLNSNNSTNIGNNANISGDINLTGDLYTPHGLVTPVVTGYVSAYINSDGRLGATPSSIRFKQDVTQANVKPLVDALKTMALVRFRYTKAVELEGDNANVELGSIAEYLDTTALKEYVYYDEEGKPMGINYERLTIPLIGAYQELNQRVSALESKEI